MTLSASWTKPSNITSRLVGWVARLPARVQTKLLIAFLSIVGLLIVLGAVGLQVLSGVNDQTNELIKLQRRIAAYRQVQHDTTNQLYSISTALLLQDDRMLDAALRQLNQFGYDLERMEFVGERSGGARPGPARVRAADGRGDARGRTHPRRPHGGGAQGPARRDHAVGRPPRAADQPAGQHRAKPTWWRQSRLPKGRTAPPD